MNHQLLNILLSFSFYLYQKVIQGFFDVIPFGTAVYDSKQKTDYRRQCR
jgi:hypothetical protein